MLELVDLGGDCAEAWLGGGANVAEGALTDDPLINMGDGYSDEGSEPDMKDAEILLLAIKDTFC